MTYDVDGYYWIETQTRIEAAWISEADGRLHALCAKSQKEVRVDRSDVVRRIQPPRDEEGMVNRSHLASIGNTLRTFGGEELRPLGEQIDLYLELIPKEDWP